MEEDNQDDVVPQYHRRLTVKRDLVVVSAIHQMMRKCFPPDIPPPISRRDILDLSCGGMEELLRNMLQYEDRDVIQKQETMKVISMVHTCSWCLLQPLTVLIVLQLEEITGTEAFRVRGPHSTRNN
jgi:hypothetical protein